MPKYFLYARKSTDDDSGKQIHSIEDQIALVTEYCHKENLQIEQIFTESQTAKVPGRPIFNSMLDQLKDMEVAGIVAWHPDRLARNSIDGGKIIYLLDQNILQFLKFPTFWFENTTQGRFMISLAFSQAKYYVDSLSENTLRGLQQKAKRGEFPGRATIGYKNDLITHKIVIDPHKSPLVKHSLIRFSQGDISVMTLARYMTLKGLRLGNGGPMSGSEMYRIVTDPFYYGAFIWKKELYPGTHQPLITKKVFDKNQQILNQSLYGKCKRNFLEFPFKGLIKCAECGHPITAETHTKKYKCSGTSQTFIYYRCTKANRYIKCSQKYLNEKDLINQVNHYISGFVWPQSKIDEALNLISEQKQQELKNQISGFYTTKSKVIELDQQINQLLDMRLKGIIADEEYLVKKNELTAKKLSLNQKNSQNGTNPNSSFEPVEIMLKNLSVASKIRDDDQNLAQKATWLKMTASNLFLDNKKLKITREKHWAALCAAATIRDLGWLSGVEPPASCSTGRRSNQLSYSHQINSILPRVRPRGIGPLVYCLEGSRFIR